MFMRRGVKIEQQSSYDCGAACLCSVAAWYGAVISLAKARQLCSCSQEGVTIKGIMDGGRALGFDCKAFKAAEKRDNTILHGIPLPAIAHIKAENGFYHFVAIYKTCANEITVMDPASGTMERRPLNQFIEEWTGYIILFEAGKDFKETNERCAVYKQFLELVGTHRTNMIFAVFCSLLVLVSGLSVSIFLQQIIDVAIPAEDNGMLADVSAVVVLLAGLGLAANYAKNICMARLGLKIDTYLISSYLRKIMALPPGFFQQYQAGDINARVGDAFNIRLFVTNGVVSIIMSFAIIAVILPVLFYYNTHLAVMTVFFIPCFVGLYILSGSINKRYNKNIAVAGAKFESSLLHTIKNMASIRYYDADDFFMGNMEENSVELIGKLYKSAKAGAGFDTAAESISKGLSVAILVSGAFYISGGGISIGEFVSFYTLCTFFSVPLLNLANMNPFITQAAVSAERFFEIIDLPQAMEDLPEKIIGEGCEKHELGGDIVVKNLNYSYGGGKELLKNVNLRIETGKITLLCGKTGLGKSTLVSLLMRYYKADVGNIFCGERDINSIDIKEWHKYISIVPQRFEIFNTSILNNITCGSKGCNMERIMQVCEAVGLMGVIEQMPLGVFTHIGEQGVMLSGGQCQKIAIARALYREPEVIILDEATSFMDEESEQRIIRHMQYLKSIGKSIVVISHKKAFQSYADRVIHIS